MDVHVRPQKAGDGYVAYDDDGHSASGATENEALIAFHTKWPEVELQGVDIGEEEVEMLDTPMEEARHQAMLDGEVTPEHYHGDIGTCLQYINALAARVDVLEQTVKVGLYAPSEPEPAQPSQAEIELVKLRQALATDWRKFVFEPSNAEVMLIGLLPLLQVLIEAPTLERIAPIKLWLESISTVRDDLSGISSYLVGAQHPDEITQAVRRVFELPS